MGKFNEKLKENYHFLPLILFVTFAISMIIILLIASN